MDTKNDILATHNKTVDNEHLFAYIRLVIGVIAQLGERLNGIQEVRSSILLSSTNSKKAHLKQVSFFFFLFHYDNWQS